jgi:anthranilate phosphoribosyltransferase
VTTEAAINAMLSGKQTEAEMTKFLTDLADRGETVEDIVGAARALRKHVSGLIAPADAIDCCGTGGDGLHTYSISTAAALVIAATGIPVAKHGNRSSSSRCGAADVLEALGVPLDVTFDKLEEVLDTLGFCFLMAPLHHKAMANVAPVRKKLKRRTIFNLIGPLANPASVRRQMVGVFAPQWVRPMAEALKALGCKGAWVVHGDGMDEITLSGFTNVAILDDKGNITENLLHGDDFGLPPVNPADLIGGDAKTNAAALMNLLEGERNAYRDTVLANAAAALMMTGTVTDLREGVDKAADALDSGRALEILESYKEHVYD